jgi:hypothetical protein
VAIGSFAAIGHVQRDHAADRYTGPTVPLAITVLYPWAQTVHDARIAITGDLFQLPFYGADLSNHVQYIGVRGPHGAFVAATTCREWRQELVAGHYDYVVIAPPAFARQEDERPETGWLESDPDAVEVAGRGGARAYRLSGAIEPSGCEG